MNRLRLRFCFFLDPNKVSKPAIENRPLPLKWLPDAPLLGDVVDIVLFILNLPCLRLCYSAGGLPFRSRVRRNSQPKTKIAFL